MDAAHETRLIGAFTVALETALAGFARALEEAGLTTTGRLAESLRKQAQAVTPDIQNAELIRAVLNQMSGGIDGKETVPDWKRILN